MEFHNEIASTGEIRASGCCCAATSIAATRRGIELDAAWQATTQLRSRTNASVSRNRIHDWTQFFDVYDSEGNFVESRPVSYRNVEPLLTPNVIVNQSIDFMPNPRFSAGAIAR